MACNIVQALDAIAGIQSAISVTFDDGTTEQVTAAYPYGEWTITAVNLPFFVCSVRQGPTNFAAQGKQAVDNVLDMFLCLSLADKGRSRAQNLRYSMEWRDAVFAAFAAKLCLGKRVDDGYLTFVLDAYISAWELCKATLGATDYWALRFELNVRERFNLPIGI